MVAGRKHLFRAVLALSLAAVLLASAHAEPAIKLARSPGRAALVGALVITEIYKLAGVEVQTVIMPPNRASAEAAAGHIDGEVARIAEYAADNPAMVRVEPPFAYVAIAAFYLDASGADIRSAKDLQKYSVGRMLGLSAFEELVAGHPNVQLAANRETLFKMLNARRFTVALDTLGSGDNEIRRAGYTGIRRTEVQRRNLYHYLNAKHKKLATTLGGLIKKLADSGQLAKMTAQAEQQVDASSQDL
jgi:hypothetical protein